MMQLWLGIGLLLVLAVLFLLMPVIMGRRDATYQRKTQNTRIYKERLAELEAEAEVAQWSSVELAELKDELGQTLLVDAETETEQSEILRKKWAIPLTLVLTIGLIASTLGLYDRWGAQNDLAIKSILEQGREQDPEQADSKAMQQELGERLQAKLEKAPNDIDSRFMLARLLMNQGAYMAAAETYAKMVDILPEEAVADKALALANVAQALFFANNRVIDNQIEAVLNDALKLNPQERTALGLLGISAFNNGDYRKAIKHWQQVLATLEYGENASAVQGGIDRAMEKLKEAGEDVSDLMPEKAELKITISVSDELKQSLPAESRVFVLARPVGGRMPLAVQSMKLQELPKEILLNDDMAMSPQAKLSSVGEVEILARVSKSGMAAPEPGDLQGMIGPINVKESEGKLLSLVIDQKIQ